MSARVVIVGSGIVGSAAAHASLYGCLPPENAVERTRLEIICVDARFAANVMADPLFDPKMSRMKA